MVALGRFAVLFLVLGVGCGSDGTTSDPLLPEATDNDSRGARAAPPAVQSQQLPPILYASFVAENAVGEAPASIAFQNDTKFIMSLWLGQAEFIAIPSGLRIGPELAASAAVATDTTTGQHKNGACVKFPIQKFDGPSVLEPGQSYSMSISLDAALGFVGALSAEPTAVPFVGLRAEVFDSTSDDFHPSQLRVELSDPEPSRDVPAPSFTTYDENRTNYVYVGSELAIESLVFSAGNGRRYSGTEPVELSRASGYTVVIDEQPATGAAAVVALDEASP